MVVKSFGRWRIQKMRGEFYREVCRSGGYTHVFVLWGVRKMVCGEREKRELPSFKFFDHQLSADLWSGSHRLER